MAVKMGRERDDRVWWWAVNQWESLAFGNHQNGVRIISIAGNDKKIVYAVHIFEINHSLIVNFDSVSKFQIYDNSFNGFNTVLMFSVLCRTTVYCQCP